MLLRALQVTLLTIALIICVFLPFLPGPYDPTAVVLSSVAQTTGLAGVLLVPIGVVWLIFGRKRKTLRLAAAIAASLLIVLAAALVSLIYNAFYLMIVLLVLGGYLAFRVVWRIAQAEEIESSRLDPIPVYLIVVPSLILVARLTFISSAVEFSRNRAIENSRPLIQAIEAFQARTGRYPESLLSLWEDYDPGVIGIPRYYYEPNGNAYNLYFEQFSDQLGVKEIVMYNKLGQHKMHAHNIDRLELSPADQIRQQGWLRVFDHPQANWKYFWFD